jgi:hypothetical protein
LWSNTSDTGLSIVVWASWAVSNTVVIVEDWVSLAPGAWSAQNEEVVEAQISVVAVGSELELVSVPWGG